VLTRSTTPIEGHVGDWLFYFNYLATKETLLWMLLLLPAVGLCVYRALKHKKADLLILIWIVVVLGVFTVAQTKMYYYILPAMPAFALAIGSLIYQAAKTGLHHKKPRLANKKSEQRAIAITDSDTFTQHRSAERN
jgi:4-amino-4-deoxy-L-arabinose transferase-like glycosyltransferase